MVIQIRIVIRIPAEDEGKIPQAIEHITDTVKQEFPALQTVKLHSPITVTIDQFEEVKPI